MRALSHAEAVDCEEARGAVCRCRCRGQYHGARRLGTMSVADFQALPRSDPHHLPDAAEIAAQKEAARDRAFIRREHRLHGWTPEDKRRAAAGIPEILRDWGRPMYQWRPCPLCLARIAERAIHRARAVAI